MSYPPPPPSAGLGFPLPSQPDSKTLALLAHLLAIFTGFIGPLVIWLVKKDTDPFVAEHGKEALNFQISVLIYVLVSVFLLFIIIGIFTLLAVVIFDLVVTIIATIAAGEGRGYRYPLCLRLIS